MIASVIVDANGEIPIPDELRSALGLNAGMQFVIARNGNRIILEPAEEDSPAPRSVPGPSTPNL
jgi:AbrB family looped-hinge helix DNA binding protein